MSSQTLTMPLNGGSARVRVTEADGKWGMSLVDHAGRIVGRSVALSAADVKALATVGAKWKEGLIWALLGYGKRGPRRPVAATICHPGAHKVA